MNPETVRPEAGVPVDQRRLGLDALNDETGPHITGRTYPVTTAEGDRGLLARYRGASADGAVVVFVIRGTGVRMVLSGPREVPTDPDTALGR